MEPFSDFKQDKCFYKGSGKENAYRDRWQVLQRPDLPSPGGHWSASSCRMRGAVGEVSVGPTVAVQCSPHTATGFREAGRLPGPCALLSPPASGHSDAATSPAILEAELVRTCKHTGLPFPGERCSEQGLVLVRRRCLPPYIQDEMEHLCSLTP